ncbi:phosphatidylethanolamine-binding protein [Mycena galopus ATCC 62051]|nr:phosphatidylethanolamine-binding protein [Mycena galopus ATCC 62051]
MKRPRRWNMPLPAGVLPAYDEALKLIRKDAWNVRKEAKRQRRDVDRLHRVLSGEVPERPRAQLEAKRAKLHVLDVQSEVNLPEVRWSVANAMADMRIPSHRHLMHVLPDVLPILHPSIDLHVTARLMPEHFESLMKRNRFQRRVNTFKEVVPGNYLTPRQTRVPPKLYANVFHTDVRLYTMLLVDPDVPDPENETYTTFLHWLKYTQHPPLATHTGRIPLLNTHTPYIPPHPQRGTPYHRYTLLLLPQPPLPGMRCVIPDEERLHFDYGINGAMGGGAHMWREVWDKYVGAVYRYELRECFA